MTNRVLLLDDDEQFRQLVRPALEAKGLTVAEAHKTTVAERAIVTFRPHLLIVDGLLPDRTGVEWITELRGHGVDIPIVFVSAFWRDLASYRRLTSELDVRLVMYKPVVPDRFAAHVASLAGVFPSTRPPPGLETRARSSAPPRPRQSLATIAGAASAEPRATTRDTSIADASIADSSIADSSIADSSIADSTTESAFTEGATTEERALVEDPSTGSIPPELRKQYARALPGIVSRLVDAAAASLEDADVTALEMLRARAHELRGTAGSFGYHEVGQLAGQIEDLTDEGLRAVTDEHFWDVAASFGASSAGALPAPCGLMAKGVVVETDALIAGQLRDTATSELIDLLPASTEERAKELIREHQPSVVVIGALGAESNGQALARSAELVRFARERRVPVLMILDDGGLAIRRRAAELGADTVLPRPVDSDRFAMALRGLRERRRRVERIVLIGAGHDELQRRLAERGFMVEAWSTEAAISTGLRGEPPDAVLAFDVEGVAAGSEVIAALRTLPAFQHVLFATISTKPGEADLLLAPNLSAAAMAERVAKGLRQVQLRGPTHEIDPYTHVLGRSLFARTLTVRLAEASRARQPLALALIGIDDAERIVAQHGAAGLSEVVRSVGHLLKGRFRAHDLRGRLAPDLFAMAFAGATSRTMAPFLESAVNELVRLPLTTAGSASLSVGIASFPDAGAAMPEVLTRAESRLERARTRIDAHAVVATD